MSFSEAGQKAARQFGFRFLAGISSALVTMTAFAVPPSCDGPFFVDAIADSAWVNIDLAPTAGTGGIRQALATARDMYPEQPVRIRLAPGFYADTTGAEIYSQRLLRSATTPVYLQATDPAPNATRLGHGINLLGVSYLAIEGVTIGPENVGAWNGTRHAEPLPLSAAAGIHVAGAARNGRTSALSGGSLNNAVYGQYEPAHHVLIRSVTVQNLYEPTDFDAETAEGYGADGIKFNQAEDVWVVDSRISQTTRHGIDNVGVHRAAFCRNTIARNGGGLGIEAKGGSTDVLYDSNVFHRVRRVELGGENTDVTYYFSLDGRLDYEALGTVARNNLIIDPREAALEFSGCASCVAVDNTIFFSATYQPPLSGADAAGGDAIRIHDSLLIGTADGAGSDCQTWDGTLNDYVTVSPCWGVGANSPAPINRILRTTDVTVRNNLFASAGAHFGHNYGGATVACPLNVLDGSALLQFNANHWWNAVSPLPAEGCSGLPEGAASIWSTSMATASPLLAVLNGTAAGQLDATSLASLAHTAAPALTPAAGSPLAARGVRHALSATVDARIFGRATMPTIGAIEIASASNPLGGLWSIDAERNGQPGRGFVIESRNGVLVMTVFAYDASGNSTFYQSAGASTNNTFSGTLDFFSGGTSFGATFSPATRAGSAGQVAVSFSDATHGTITFPGELPQAFSKFDWASPASANGFSPARGLWGIDAEMNGQPGRGFTIEAQGDTFVMTVFGYSDNGRGDFYQAVGPLAGQSFSGTLETFRNGTSFGAPWTPATSAGSRGGVTLRFSDATHGTITLPGEPARNISKFVW